jgi:glycosyltransferase involved in cell wall biosynthesis
MKKTILFIHQSSELYGSDKVLLVLVKKLNKDLFVPIVVLPKKGLLYDALLQENIRVIITPVMNIHKQMFSLKELFLLPIYLIKSIVTLNRELKNTKIDIVQSNTVVVTLGFIYAKLKRLKHFWHIHEVMHTPRIAVKVFPALVNRFSDLTIFNSETTKESFCMEQPKIRQKSIVIYNGIERDKPQLSENELEKLRQTLSFEKEDIVLGLVGRLNKDKGHILLLDSFYKIASKYNNLKLLFIGSPVEGKEEVFDQINCKIQYLNLQNKVTILPFQKNIWNFWDIIDIAIAPSTIKESFCLVALEAMLSKKAVVASDLGALKEVILNNETGFLFDINSSQSLEDKISILVEDKSLRLEFGEKGKQRALNTFTLVKYIREFEKIY